MRTFDLCVIGGGSGGVRAARVASQHGARVLLAEADRMGGTCVIRGCVPKKLWVLASRVPREIADAAGFGWTLPAGQRFDWPAFQARVAAEVARLEGVYTRNLEAAGVTVVAARATVSAERRVRLLPGGEEISARQVLVATGGHPFLPPLAQGGDALAASSDDFFDWPRQPRRVLVQGTGYIGLELGCLLHQLGSEVTLIGRGDGILRGFDGEMRAHLQAALQAQGLVVRGGTELLGLSGSAAWGQGDGEHPQPLVATLSDGTTLEVDAVLRAVGRRPASAGLGLQALGLTLGPDGAIPVDAHSATSLPWLHAVGDVTGRVALTPAAIREGHAYADTVFGGKPTAVQLSGVPTAIFSTPEAATVGLTEEAALQAHGALDIYLTRFRPMKTAMAGRDERMLMKLVVDRASDRVLGVHLVGPEAGEMIQLAGIAVQAGLRKADLDATLAVHPTAAEELVTMRTVTRRAG